MQLESGRALKMQIVNKHSISYKESDVQEILDRAVSRLDNLPRLLTIDGTIQRCIEIGMYNENYISHILDLVSCLAVEVEFRKSTITVDWGIYDYNRLDYYDKMCQV
jgi:hypothetical protein